MATKKETKEAVPTTRICDICGRTSGQIKRFIRHHLRYKGEWGEEITCDLCFACHERAHGRRCYNHPFEKIYGKDIGPYIFAKRLARLYEDAWMWSGEWLGTAIVKLEKRSKEEK